MNKVGFNSVLRFLTIKVIAYGESDFRTFEFVMYKYILLSYKNSKQMMQISK